LASERRYEKYKFCAKIYEEREIKPRVDGDEKEGGRIKASGLRSKGQNGWFPFQAFVV
jgi:hypothetical protein